MSDIDDTARRLVAHPRWEWRQGMRGTGPLFFGARPTTYTGRLSVKLGQPCVILKRNLKRGTAEMCFFAEPPFPDLTDPATAGVLLEMLDEACTASDDAWSVDRGSRVLLRVHRGPHGLDTLSVNGDTLGEAVARALLEVL